VLELCSFQIRNRWNKARVAGHHWLVLILPAISAGLIINDPATRCQPACKTGRFVKTFTPFVNEIPLFVKLCDAAGEFDLPVPSKL
jgi:hypothetical protein